MGYRFEWVTMDGRQKTATVIAWGSAFLGLVVGVFGLLTVPRELLSSPIMFVIVGILFLIAALAASGAGVVYTLGKDEVA